MKRVFLLNWQKLDKKLLDRIQMLVTYFQTFTTKALIKPFKLMGIQRKRKITKLRPLYQHLLSSRFSPLTMCTRVVR